MTPETLLQQLSSMQEFFNRSTRLLNEEDSQFTPAEGMYTAAGQIAHAAQTIEWFMEGAFSSSGFDMDFEASDRKARSITSITAARDWFEKACAGAKQTISGHSSEEWSTPIAEGPIMGGMPRWEIFTAITDHSAHHRGALTVYCRLLGKVPPMPYGGG